MFILFINIIVKVKTRNEKMAQIEETATEGEIAIFKKKVLKMSEYKGRGTELISVYIPEEADRGSVMGQLSNELSQSSNIKSPQTRKNVQGALRKITNFLKHINFKIPKNGLVVFAGNISQSEGKTDLKLFTARPVKPLRTKLYWCDSEFHLAPLKDMLQPSDVYVLVTLDKSEATLALLKGKRYEIDGHFNSGVAGKQRAGGQSAKRFEHLREEAAQEFYKRISEKINSAYMPLIEKLKGIIIGGPGITKNYFLNKEMIDYRLREKIIGTVDTSYTDEAGIRELVQKSEELLKDTDLMRERKAVNDFLGEVVKDNLAAYGKREVEKALEAGKVSVLLLSEDLEWKVYKTQCGSCNHEQEFIEKDPKKSFSHPKCEKCKSATETVEEIDYIDYLLEKAQSTGSEVKVISTDTAEGEQFFKAFSGIGAMLRYK